MMMLTAWKPIQLLFLFAVFAILGWLMEQVLYFVTGRAALRGWLSGPWGILSGLGGIVLVTVILPLEMYWFELIPVLMVLAMVLNGLGVLGHKVFLGAPLWRFSMGFSMFAGLLCMIGVELSDRILWLMDWLPAPAMLVLLLAFYLPFTRNVIDGLALTFFYRRRMEDLEDVASDKTPRYKEDALAILAPYRRWLWAYPAFFDATAQKMLRFMSWADCRAFLAETIG